MKMYAKVDTHYGSGILIGIEVFPWGERMIAGFEGNWPGEYEARGVVELDEFNEKAGCFVFVDTDFPLKEI